MMITFRFCIALCALLLAACAGVPTSPPPQKSMQPFELAGRIVVRHQDRGFSSSLRWKQAAGSDEIWLTAPLGQTIAYLQADASGASFTGADQKQYRASSIESLTNRAFGWRFPVAGLRHWVLGQPAADMTLDGVERDATGRILRMKQDAWQVRFTYVNAAAMPSRLEMASADVEIRFAIDDRTPAR